MKVTIEADQAELDEKRPELLKALAGDRFECVVKARTETVYKLQQPALTPRMARLPVQQDLTEYWLIKWDDMIEQMKREIADVLHSD